MSMSLHLSVSIIIFGARNQLSKLSFLSVCINKIVIANAVIFIRKMPENNSALITDQIKLIRKYLKLKILEDNVTFRNHDDERKHIYDLMKRTICHGESHSALMIGPRGCGKTNLINSALCQISKELDITKDAIIVKLNGLIHGDEKLALKAITAQMQLENAVGDRVFGTFAENLAFLLSCLQSGVDRRCKSMVFVLDEFDMFCHSGRVQTLLYNLFDITHSEQSPMCVVGITSRIDIMELLEKRVKSRFSHRHILIFPNAVPEGQTPGSPLENCRRLLVALLSLPPREVKRKKGRRRTGANQEEPMDIDQDNYSVPEEIFTKCKIDPQQFTKLDPGVVEEWNAHIRSLVDNEKVVDAVEMLCYFTVNEQIFRNVLFQTVSKLSQRTPHIEPNDLTKAIKNAVCPERRVQMLQSLSALEISLAVAMMHTTEVLDGQPSNFEMVLNRYTKFANANSSTQAVPRPVILKAFEHLISLEIIVPTRMDSSTDTTASKVQKEYKLYTLAVPNEEIKEAIKGYKALPTEISQWVNNSVL